MVKPINQLGPDLRRKIEAMERTSRAAAKAAVRQAAEVGKAAHLKTMTADSGGDLRLSGVNRAKGRAGNAKIGVRFRVSDRDGSPTAEIKATGPLQILNNPTSGHVIRSAYSKGRYRTSSRGRGRETMPQFIGPVLGGQFRGDRRAVLNIPGVGFRRSARHPGTRGKDTWERGRRQARIAMSRAITREADRQMAAGWRKG